MRDDVCRNRRDPIGCADNRLKPGQFTLAALNRCVVAFGKLFGHRIQFGAFVTRQVQPKLRKARRVVDRYGRTVRH